MSVSVLPTPWGTGFPPGPLLRTVDELDDPGLRQETVLRLPTARVVFADYALLRHDFPHLREADAALIDRWLLRHAAFISTAQAAQSRVNTPIETGEERTVAYRPTRYGRAVVVSTRESHGLLPADPALPWEAEPDRLLDLKGTGVAPGVVPRHDPGGHFDGLISLQRVLIEVLFQEVIEAAFRHSGSGFSTVPAYAVLDLGFEIVWEDGRTFPAGMQVRRAHRRPPNNEEVPPPGTPEERLKMEVELLLRRYGITSCTEALSVEMIDGEEGTALTFARRNLPRWSEEAFRAVREGFGIPRGGRIRFEGVNVQLTREVGLDPLRAQLVDFGHFSRRDRFDSPVVTFVDGPVAFPLGWGRILWPHEAGFVQPDPALLLPDEHWGRPVRPDEAETIRQAPPGIAHSRACLAVAGLVPRYRAGELSGEEVRAGIGEVAATATARWPRA
ncbi:MAG TPA: hypothetical protein VE685_17050 [Thermoanaerobaculia bacterium]|nr:hypothetical protein [Thermoanaerobaculia bacterium]